MWEVYSLHPLTESNYMYQFVCEYIGEHRFQVSAGSLRGIEYAMILKAYSVEIALFENQRTSFAPDTVT